MKRFFPFFFILLVLFPVTAMAAAGPWQRDNDIGVRLIAGVDGTGSEAAIPLALEIEMAPGWHTYWRSPGPLGLPPQIDWQKSQTDEGNLGSATLLYPAPIRFGEPGFEAFGYRERVVMPIDAHVKVPGKPLVIEAAINLLACQTMCVPKNFTLSLNVPAGAATPSPEMAVIEVARATLPDGGQRAGWSVIKAHQTDESLQITVKGNAAFAAPDVFVENDKNIMFAKPEIEKSPDGLTVSFTVKPADKLPDDVKLSKLPLTVTIADGARAMEQRLDPAVPVVMQEVAPAPQIAPQSVPDHAPIWVFVILALLGGFILNLTPCVLPVLSLKILGMIRHGGGEHAHVRRSFLMTACGILFSFLVLAGVTMALKATGNAVGWGVQFQQPVFLVFMVLLLTLFAANLWDLYEIPLPRFLADRLDPHHHPKLAGDFVTGAFATLLATPCTAPFLGTAVGFALTEGPREIFVIFTALGFGMMLPYLIVAIHPNIATLLPKPGAWMNTLRHILGSMLAVTAIWMLYVLSSEIDRTGAALVAACMTGIAYVLYRQHHVHKAMRARYFVAALMAVAFIVALRTPAPAVAPAGNVAWQSFDEAALDNYVKQGKTVFVDITADWCVNCKANKQFTLARDDIKNCLFSDPNVVAMRADWTSPNPKIADFLKKHGRYGIPFNAVFGPASPDGVILPELLTPGIVKDGLGKAADKPYTC